MLLGLDVFEVSLAHLDGLSLVPDLEVDDIPDGKEGVGDDDKDACGSE